MKRRIIQTADGSKTIQIEDWDEQYHSLHGAVQEAHHVFIDHGLRRFRDRQVNLLEMGFGTGLNALISLMEAPGQGLEIEYVGIEAYPVRPEEVAELDYPRALGRPDLTAPYLAMHHAPWGHGQRIGEAFLLTKLQMDFMQVTELDRFDLVYFDAFGARVQPELWTEVLFTKMFQALKPGGILVTYAAKGSVRRALLAVGFQVERLPGPPGKREMLRAGKP